MCNLPPTLLSVVPVGGGRQHTALSCLPIPAQLTGDGLPPQTPHCLLAPVEGERRQGAWRGDTAIAAITWNTLQQL